MSHGKVVGSDSVSIVSGSVEPVFGESWVIGMIITATQVILTENVLGLL